MLSTSVREPQAQRGTRANGNAACVAAHTAARARPRRDLASRTAGLNWPQGRDVHVWNLDLRDMGADAASLLDSAETRRAQRFVYAHDWRRYVAAHAWLRRILGAYSSVPPQHLRFTAGAHGKPVLVQTPRGEGRPPLCFNLSHSKDVALVAVTAGLEVGVDIEAVRDDLPGPDLAAGVLSAAELDQLAQCPAPDHPLAFVGCWTLKEACLKALGVGLGLAPRALDVGLLPARQALRLDGSEAPIDIAPLPAPAGYCAALAVVGGFAKVDQQDAAHGLEQLN